MLTNSKQILAYRAATLRTGMKLMKLGIKPHRGWTQSKAMKLVSEYTGKEYKRGDFDVALSDMNKYLEDNK